MEIKIIGLTWRDKKRASKVWGYFGDDQKREWVWAGHVMRRTDNKLTTKVKEWRPKNWRRSQGSQNKTRWRDEIKAFAGTGGRTHAVIRQGEGENVGRGNYPAVCWQWLIMMMMMMMMIHKMWGDCKRPSIYTWQPPSPPINLSNLNLKFSIAIASITRQ